MSPSELQRIPPSNPGDPQHSTLPFWVPAIVVVGALLMCTGGILALVHPVMLVPAGEAINEAVRVYSGYLFSRDVAIGLLLIGALSIGARSALGCLMVLTAFIQLLDAGIDCMEGRWIIAPGVLILGIVFLAGATRVLGRPWWGLPGGRSGLFADQAEPIAGH